ncbi:DUF488 domain-containing protein [Aquisalimonas lutea]|uniref:DUF488 domain-containing protein n=1 Tax=Aquisalimonas lutea TaxID=1327750 RepID=UPI0025B4524F|nr:DUF488 domain-containing protein [Aquisalimonas lutea]MDN3517304.1 DUF488 domain-containing protein [Aquisalimonas lutea]
MTTEIRIKRVHDPAEPEDGTRVLVDRVWPRGVRKADAAIDLWEKEVAPSTELRKWFGHDPERWQGFRERYRAELADAAAALHRILDRAGDGPLTLVFAARDREHNNAVVLREVLRERLAPGGSASPTCYASEFPEYNGLDRS